MSASLRPDDDETDRAISVIDINVHETSDEDISKRIKMEEIKTMSQSPTSQVEELEKSTSSPDSCAKALGNPLVLREILRNISSVELLHFRFINWLWRDTSTSILRRRRDNTLWFSYDPDCKSYKMSSETLYIVQDEEGRDYTLKNLLQLFPEESSSNFFPCGHFKFAEGSLIHKEIQQFLRCFGENIRGLTLDDIFITTDNYDSDDDEEGEEDGKDHNEEEDVELPVTFDLSPLRTLLLEQAPNIEFLHVSRSFYIPESFSLFFKPSSEESSSTSSNNNNRNITLPNLKILKLNTVTNPDSMQLVQELLEAAVGLRSVEVEENYRLSTLEWFHSINRLDLIHDFHFRLSDLEVVVLEKISGFQLNLKRIEVSAKPLEENSWGDEDARKRNVTNVNALSKIFAACQNSLEILRVNSPAAFGLIPGLEWPISSSSSSSSSVKTDSNIENVTSMSKVTRLELFFHSNGASVKKDEQFSRGLISFRQLFPNLTTVRIEGKAREIFAPHEVLDQVTRLEIIEGANTQKFMEDMTRAFPKLEILAMSRVKRLIDFGSAIWQFKELTTLELELLLDGRRVDWDSRQAITNKYPNLDVVFAGFSESQLTRMMEGKGKTGDNTVTSEELEQLRSSRGSILDCKKLRKLDISFYDGVNSTRRRSDHEFHLLSHVSGMYAFGQMPNLNVTLSIRPNAHPTDPYDDEDTDSESNSEASYHSSDERCLLSFRNPEDYSYDHDEYLKKLESALMPMAVFQNVRIVQAKYHDLSIFRT